MTPTPLRLQLSRRAGFDLQAASRAANGLSAINVARPSRWGNPWRVGQKLAWWIPDDATGPRINMQKRVVITPEIAVHQFRLWLGPDRPLMRQELKEALAGHNLACWCAPGTPCHADILLGAANP